MTETDILWYDLCDYVCWFWCNAHIFSPSLLWASLTSIMNYPLCMTHNLATVNRYDHAWTDNWAQNICKLSMLMFPIQLRCDGRQHDRRGRLYATKVKWKFFLTCFALLDVGFVLILRRMDNYILIRAFSAVSPNSITVIFQNVQALKQNYCVV